MVLFPVMEEHPPKTDGNSRSTSPSAYIVEPSSVHVHSVILLHGLGSNGTKFGTELLETGIRSDGASLRQLLPSARFIFPTAKRRRSSAFRRTRLTQWFDIASLDDPSYRNHTQIQGLEESYLEIREILAQEISKVSARNVILGGLSQGLAVGAISLLAMEHPIGGFIGMSGWMPFRQDIHSLVTGEGPADDEDNPFGEEGDVSSTSEAREPAEQEPIIKAANFVRDLLSVAGIPISTASQTAIDTPIFLGHGSADSKITLELGEDVRTTLKAIGFKVRWEVYREQGHWYKVPDEIDDITDFIGKTVGWVLEETA